MESAPGCGGEETVSAKASILRPPTEAEVRWAKRVLARSEADLPVRDDEIDLLREVLERWKAAPPAKVQESKRVKR